MTYQNPLSCDPAKIKAVGTAGGTPILALDMYEHSYHLEFGAKAANYAEPS
jgi:superoxide dismutase